MAFLSRLSIGWFLCMALQAEAVEPKTPQQTQIELEADEALFHKTKESLNPWYTGPLITSGASMMAPGYGNIQPYLFFIDRYALLNKERKKISVAHKNFTFNPSIGVLMGVTPWMDVSLSFGANLARQQGHSGGGFSDVQLTVGWPLCKETPLLPAIKLTLAETFPTGAYQRLRTNGLGLDATGGGSWKTKFGLAFSKLLFYSSPHPLNSRLFLGYQVASQVKVHDFNAYGGGFGTYGKVHPGALFTANLGLEWSLTQSWALATDCTYYAQKETLFKGKVGTTSTGVPAAVGGGYADQMTLAPAIEYNWNKNLGALVGVQFSVYGRNSAAFVTPILSLCWNFGPL